MKNYYENKESSHLKYWGVNNLYGWIMHQKVPVDGLKSVKNTSQFNEDFVNL